MINPQNLIDYIESLGMEPKQGTDDVIKYLDQHKPSYLIRPTATRTERLEIRNNGGLDFVCDELSMNKQQVISIIDSLEFLGLLEERQQETNIKSGNSYTRFQYLFTETAEALSQ